MCGLRGLELGAAQRHQVVFDVLVDPAVQGLDDRETERGQEVTLKNGLIRRDAIILDNKVKRAGESGGGDRGSVSVGE